MNIVFRIAAAAGVCALVLAAPARASAVVPTQEFELLAARCAPAVHPQTLAAVVRQESRFNAWAIGVNGSPAVRVRAKSLDEAVASAERLIAQGRSIDVGLGQINSVNLRWLGLSVRNAFDPCRNLTAAARVLTENYRRYRRGAASDQAALDAALSAYNTGSRTGGLRNGYVAKVRGGIGATTQHALAVPAVQTESRAVASPPEPAAAWDAFGRAAAERTQWDVFARAAGVASAVPAAGSGQ